MDEGAVAGLLDALDFAARKHRDQRRKGAEASPYINHPIRVALLLAGPGHVDDVEILEAAVLHDTLEDTRTTTAELVERFGTRVSALVEEVSDDRGLPKSERWRIQIERAAGLSDGAKQIKIADKIANVRDIAEAPPKNWSDGRRREYLEWAHRVVRECRGVNAHLDSLWEETLELARVEVGPIESRT